MFSKFRTSLITSLAFLMAAVVSITGSQAQNPPPPLPPPPQPAEDVGVTSELIHLTSYSSTSSLGLPNPGSVQRIL